MPSQTLTVTDDGLRLDGTEIPAERLLGFVEHWDAWRGVAWLEILGVPGARVHVDAGYGALRRSLRDRYSHLPFLADWASGRFPAMPTRQPALPVWFASTGLVTLCAIALWTLAGWGYALVWLAAWVWPLARLRDQVVVSAHGLGIGAPWTPTVPWPDVEAVYAEVDGARTVVTAKTRSGTTPTGIPTALLPAFRARVHRLGGLAVHDRANALDRRYASWVAASSGVPWGVLVGGSISVWWLPQPWLGLRVVLLAALALTLLGATVRARHTGWRTGAMLWATLTYAAVLVAVSLAG